MTGSAFFRLMPAGAPERIYTTILKPAPLRRLANALLLKLIPPTIALPEGTLFLNQSDPVVSGALALGAYEPETLARFRAALKPGAVVVDIGANLGLYTIIASKIAREVIAFEPEPENAAFLQKSVAANGRGNVRIVESAVGEREETLTLALHPDNKGKHTLINDGDVETIAVPVATLDHSLEELGVLHVDLIKMDVEGWEAAAFAGMARTLSRDRPTILFEYVPGRIAKAGGDPIGMIANLRDLGYRLFVIDEKRPGAEIPFPDDPTALGMKDDGGYMNILAVQ